MAARLEVMALRQVNAAIRQNCTAQTSMMVSQQQQIQKVMVNHKQMYDITVEALNPEKMALQSEQMGKIMANHKQMHDIAAKALQSEKVAREGSYMLRLGLKITMLLNIGIFIRFCLARWVV